MADLALPSPGATTERVDARRSTRVFQAVPLSVSGMNELGNPFVEMTSVVAFNCHGCLYRSRYHNRPGSWVTLHMANADSGKAQPVRAQVRFVRLPANPTELYQVGVELENPANVWSIPAPPEDWSSFAANIARKVIDAATSEKNAGLHVVSDSGSSAAQETRNPEAPSTAQAANAAGGKQVRVVVSSDQLLQRLESKLQQAADKAVEAAMTARFSATVSQAAKAIDDFSQSSVRKVQRQVDQYREQMLVSAREQFLTRVQADLASAEQRIQQRVEALLSRAETTAKSFEEVIAQNEPALAEAEDSFRKASLRSQYEYAARVGEIASRTEAQLGERVTRIADQQTARVNEQAQNTVGAAAKQLQSRSEETRAQLVGVAGTALAELHVAAKNEIDRAVGESRGKVEASLKSFAEETTASWEARLRACQDELAQTSAKEAEEFRTRLQAILNSSMIAATSAVSEHAKALLMALTEDAEHPEQDSRRGAS